MGHLRRFDPVPATSGLSRTTDIGRPGRRVREVPGSDIVGLVWYEWGRFNWTGVILVIGMSILAWGAFQWIWLPIMQPPSWDIGVPWAVLEFEVGVGIVGIGILKFVLLDRLWGSKF
jgi:hypothetical protein